LQLHTARSAIFVPIRVKPLLFSAPPRLRGEHVFNLGNSGDFGNSGNFLIRVNPW